MPHRREAVENAADHPLRRRVGGQQFRVCRFESLQALEQPVVLGIRDLRIVEDVAAVGVVLQLSAQLAGVIRGSGSRPRGGLVNRCGAVYRGSAETRRPGRPGAFAFLGPG
jgi:hypothetical protein